jgi:hypothetical protein
MTWQLYGTDDPLLSTVNSRGNLENWILIDSDTTGLDTDPGRGQVGVTIPVDSTLGYLSYRLVFPTVRNAVGANSMQVAEIRLDGQVVPEPSTFVLAGMAVTAFGLVARRRNTRSA